ncbi:MAG: vitamin K epoxide reductase family protein [Patescibacteria group bacterium]
MQLFLALLLIILSLTGIVDASYITYQDLTNQIPPCSEEFQCEKVLTSEYAAIGPIPVSGLGIVYYLAAFILAIFHYLQLDLKKLPLLRQLPYPVRALDGLLVVTATGFLFSIYLVVLMAFIIQGWCLYCLISAGISTALFIITQLYNWLYSSHSSFPIKDCWYRLSHWGYKTLSKPLLFLLNPDRVHHAVLALSPHLSAQGVFKQKLRWFYHFKHPSLQQSLAGIPFANPVGLPAGYDYNGDLTDLTPELGYGWHTVGTVTFQPYQGNKPPFYTRLPQSEGLIVNKGLKNDGAKAIAQKLAGKPFKIPTGISIASTNTSFQSTKEQILDILQSFIIFETSSVQHSYYELNISCPNVFGGEPFTTPQRLESLLSALDKLYLSKPTFIKMPIDQSTQETEALLKTITNHQVAGVIFGNLTKDKNNAAITQQERKIWANSAGNVSGKATFERSNQLLSLAKKTLPPGMVIIGTGGIFTPADADRKISLGADLVQLITGSIFEGPQLVAQINLSLAAKN